MNDSCGRCPRSVLQKATEGVWCDQQESNLYLSLRRTLFYPLNYGRESNADIVQGARSCGAEA